MDKMFTICCFFLGCFALIRSGLSAQDDIISFLPGLPHQPMFRQYSGYLKAQGTKKFHYWFVESQNNPKSDPVVLWLNGGPGCSSLDGFLSEHGPFLVNSDGKTLHYNPYSWNKVANMLYLESPAGVGFSYSDDKNYTTDDDTVSMDNYVALLAFFVKFPQFKNNPFFVTGESYGGVYVPTLSYRILQGNSTINMKGFAVGNGLLSYVENFNSLVYFGYYHGLFGDEHWHQLQKLCCVDGKCLFYNKTNLPCLELTGEVLRSFTKIGLNTYGLYQNCSGLKSKDVRLFFAFKNLLTTINKKTKYFHTGKLGLTPPCLNSTAANKYLNTPSVRQAIHIPTMLPNWTICSEVVNKNYKMVYETLSPVVLKLIQHYRGMVYNGDTDMACNFLGDQEFVESLGLKVVKERRFWKIGPQIAGFVKDFEKLSFVTIKGAGHMVPEDKPSEALKMFISFLENKPLQ
ncbi:lysosomal protective protein-like [Dendronephthya gigantea]|uniref:lysosomal protective protein-like n=1 Tax=Dendronephthya gigantea TaxID=151771 RepID=UPI00106AA7B6|nr:lysosomal protective protein-like [Dendronephthya gigantea]